MERIDSALPSVCLPKKAAGVIFAVNKDDQLRFLTLAVRSSYEVEARPALIAAAPSIDWERLATLAARHRVEGLAWDGLVEAGVTVPSPHDKQFREQANQITAQQLRDLSTCAQIIERFAEAGAALRFLKGIALALKVYPRPMAKNSSDIDILVPSTALTDTALVLHRLGFRLVTPSRAEQLTRWHARRKESVWVDRHGTHLDLHTRLADSPALLCDIDPWSHPSVASISGIEFATLDDADQYAYLCVHGTSSAWFRLKWLADLHAFILSRTDELDRWHRKAEEAGVGRLSRVALALLAERFSLGAARSLLEQRPLTTVERGMIFIATAQLRSPDEPTARPLGTLTIHLLQMLQRPGPAFATRELARQLGEMTTR